MKRLLAASSGSIFQISKVFRNQEHGSTHNPEFTMLEWYRENWSYQQVLTDINQLFDLLTQAAPLITMTYETVFQNYYQHNPHHIKLETLRILGNQHLNLADNTLNQSEWLDILFDLSLKKLNEKIRSDAPAAEFTAVYNLEVWLIDLEIFSA